jgi:hypothetical protein
MKTKLIKKNCKSIFDGRVTNEMVSSIEEIFDEWMMNHESKGLENDVDEFFDEMSLDIECELESWD